MTQYLPSVNASLNALATILTRAKLSGAGLDNALGAGGAGGANQAMFVKTEINVSQAAAATPPNGALHSDKASESTYGGAPHGAIDGTIGGQRA